MKLAEIEVGQTYEYHGGRPKAVPVRVLEKEQKRERTRGGDWRNYWVLRVVVDADAWGRPVDPIDQATFRVRPNQLVRPWAEYVAEQRRMKPVAGLSTRSGVTVEVYDEPPVGEHSPMIVITTTGGHDVTVNGEYMEPRRDG